MKKLFLCLAAMVLSSVMVAQTISSSTVSLRFCFDDAETINEEVCPNVGITINGTTYTEAGTYYQNLQTTRGCDSTLTIVITESENCTPEGAINGLFSVSATKQVYFSKGNLQYCANPSSGPKNHAVRGGGTADGVWRFAEHQYDCITTGNASISSSNSGWIDLFGWGTSGYNGKYPHQSSQSESDYFNQQQDLTGDYANYDWGVYNAISNGGNEPGMWRTLTETEWEYLFARENKTALAKVGNVVGIMILPDVWSGASININMSYTNFNTNPRTVPNTYTADQWAIMENHGAVFFPFNFYRNGTAYCNGSTLHGRYWHASCIHDTSINQYSSKARYWYHDGGYSDGSPTGYRGFHVSWDLMRHYGMCVRLVADK